MKDESGLYPFDIPASFDLLRNIPVKDFDDWLQRCKSFEAEKIISALDDEQRLRVQHRVKFVEDWRIFFQKLLTKS